MQIFTSSQRTATIRVFLVFTLVIAIMLLSSSIAAHETSTQKPHQTASAQAYYLANEAVMITQHEGETLTKIIFDPLFENTFGTYEPLPIAMRDALLTGSAPFNNIDAVFISHFHGDHFSPNQMLSMLDANPTITLIAPPQAVDALLKEDSFKNRKKRAQQKIRDRIQSVSLEYGDAPAVFSIGAIHVEAVRIPHAGGEGRRSIQNMLYRVTLNNQSTVIHMGDAAPEDHHFSAYEDLWKKRATDLALPPYWFFASQEGSAILTDRLRAIRSVGIHAPVAMPDDPTKRSDAYKDAELFTEPAQTKTIP